MSQFLFQNNGGQYLSWKHGAPRTFRSAESRELGDAIIHGGSPEPLTGGMDTFSRSLVTIGLLGAAAWVVLSVLGRRAHRKAYKQNPARKRRKKARRNGRRRRLARSKVPWMRARRQGRRRAGHTPRKGKGWAVEIGSGRNKRLVYDRRDPFDKKAAELVARAERAEGGKAKLVSPRSW